MFVYFRYTLFYWNSFYIANRVHSSIFDLGSLRSQRRQRSFAFLAWVFDSYFFSVADLWIMMIHCFTILSSTAPYDSSSKAIFYYSLFG